MKAFWNDVQALVGRGLVNRAHSAHLLLKISDVNAFKTWLREDLARDHPRLATTPDVSGRFDHKRPGRALYQIAFSPAGLRMMGAGDEVMQGFSEPFIDGMAPAPDKGARTTRRAGILGDVGANNEVNWNWGGATGKGVKGDEIHVFLMLFSHFSKARDSWVEKVLAPTSGLSLACGGRRAAGSPCAIMTRLERKKCDPDHPIEHFGFLDGLSQPVIKGLPRAEHMKRVRPETYRLHAVAAGEFVLGQPNERTICTPYPDGFGKNGSYLVVRQLDQHVGAFNELVEDLAGRIDYETDEDLKELAAAKIMGRYRDGRPLTDMPRENGSFSSFGFAERDAAGLRCPIGSHVRRANPRDSREDDPEISLRLSKRHRVMRRGRIYGDMAENGEFQAKDEAGRGLLFMCVNADIAQQFEFVQQSWLNHTTFAGLDGEVDPVVSGLEPSEKRYTTPGRPTSAIVQRKKPLTTVVGGAYFFLPGKAALSWLAKQPAS